MNSDTGLIYALKNGPVEIKFIKLDGSVRTMIATTNTDLFTYNHVGSPIQHDPNIVRVWDLMNDGWRSIRLNSVISWTV